MPQVGGEGEREGEGSGKKSGYCAVLSFEYLQKRTMSSTTNTKIMAQNSRTFTFCHVRVFGCPLVSLRSAASFWSHRIRGEVLMMGFLNNYI